MSRKKKILLGIIIVLVVVWVGVYKFGSNKKADTVNGAEDKIVPRVGIQVIEKRDEIRVPVFLSGKIKPKKYTLVKSKSNGYLQYIMGIGEEVRAGQELFRIYDEGVEANYYNALAGLVTAQQSLAEVKAVSYESVKQAELGVKIAEANLSLGTKSLVNTRKSTEQGIETARDSGRASYESAYNSVEQMMRFLGGANASEYAFKGLLNYNSLARAQAEEQFRKALHTNYANEDANYANMRMVDANVEEGLEEMEGVIGEVKRAGDLAYVDLNYCLVTIDFSQTIIDGYKAQLSALLLSLNGANASVKAAKNGIKTAKNAKDSVVEAAEIRVLQAENGVENAKASLELAKSGVKTRRLGAEAQLNGAQGQFDMAKYQFDNLVMPARFSGTVISNLKEAGDQVSIGTGVLEMGNVGEIEIELEISPRDVRYLTVGAEAKIKETRNKEIKKLRDTNSANDANYYVGTLTEIGPAALGGSGKVVVVVEADNSDYQFVAGEVAEVELELVYRGDGMILVPLSSVVVGQNESYVWIVSEEEAEKLSNKEVEGDDGNLKLSQMSSNNSNVKNIVNKRIIVTGEVYGGMVEVVSGLSEGDRVVVERGGFLGEGDSVEIEKQEIEK